MQVDVHKQNRRARMNKCTCRQVVDADVNLHTSLTCMRGMLSMRMQVQKQADECVDLHTHVVGHVHTHT